MKNFTLHHMVSDNDPIAIERILTVETTTQNAVVLSLARSFQDFTIVTFRLSREERIQLIKALVDTLE